MHRLLKPFINWRSVLITSVASASTCEAQTSKESKLKEEACFKRGTLIVKYGGSAITQKNKLETLKRDILIASAGDIKFAYDSEKWNRIVLVHGAGWLFCLCARFRLCFSTMRFNFILAGSFGHFQAKQYALKNGRGSDDDMENNNSSDCWKTGLSLTRQSVLKLNAEVLAAHITAGLPAVAISPFPSTVTGRILDSPLSPINPRGSVVVQPGALADVLGVAQKGLLPVVHGDVVLDASQTCAVLGGDHIIAWYACVEMFSQENEPNL